MTIQTTEKGLSGALHHTIDHLYRNGLRNTSLATLVACWIAGTYLEGLFNSYGSICLRPGTSQQAGKVLTVIEALIHTPVRHMTASRLYPKYSIGRYSPRVAFTCVAPLSIPLAESCFSIVVDADDTCEPRSSGERGVQEFNLVRYAFQEAAYYSYERIEALYATLGFGEDVLCGYESHLKDIARPLLVMASVADQYFPEHGADCTLAVGRSNWDVPSPRKDEHGRHLVELTHALIGHRDWGSARIFQTTRWAPSQEEENVMEFTLSKEAVLKGLDQTVFWRKELPDLKPNKDGESSACCPFHEDRTPSFCVNLATGLWICHAGCGSGDVFSFVQKRDGLEFPQAVAKLAADLGLASVESLEPRKIIRVFPYTDPAGHVAYKLRWNSGQRFSWALDPKGGSGMGECKPTLPSVPDRAL